MEKQHKYNVGDKIMVQIASVTENNGKTVYRIKGIENIKFSEGGINSMNTMGIKPGDIAYEAIVDFDDKKIYLGAMKIEDVSTKEIKIAGDWFAVNDNELVYDREEAEILAKNLSERYNYPVIRKGLLKEGGNNGKEV